MVGNQKGCRFKPGKKQFCLNLHKNLFMMLRINTEIAQKMDKPTGAT